MNVFMKVFMWCVAITGLIFGLVFLPSFASILFLLVAVIAAPIPKVKQFFESKGLRGWIKAALLVVVFTVAIVITPDIESEAPAGTETVSASEAIAESGESVTSVVEEVVEEIPSAPVSTPSPSLSPTQPPTNTPTPTVEASPDPSPTQEQEEQIYKYVGSAESDKYHDPDCRHAKNIKESNEIWFTSTEDAEANGYKPCGTCQ